MSKNDQQIQDPKSPGFRVTFPRENKDTFSECVKFAGKKSLSLAAFGRLAIINYIEQIKEKKVIL